MKKLIFLSILLSVSSLCAQEAGNTADKKDENSNKPIAEQLSSVQKEKISQIIKKFIKSPGEQVNPEDLVKIRDMGKPAVLQILREIENKERPWEERSKLFVFIKNAGEDFVTDDLIEIAKDKQDSEYVRSAAVKTIYEIGRENDLDAYNALVSLEKDEKSAAFRRDLIMAAGKVGQKQAISYYKDILDGSYSDNEKASAIYGLGKINDPEIEDILIDKLNKDKGSLTVTYARVLAEYTESKKVSEALLQKLNGYRDRKDRINVGIKMKVLFESIGKIGGQGAIGDVKKYLDDSDLNVSIDAGICLLNLGDFESIKKVIERAKKEGGDYNVKRLKNAYKKKTGKVYQ